MLLSWTSVFLPLYPRSHPPWERRSSQAFSFLWLPVLASFNNSRLSVNLVDTTVQSVDDPSTFFLGYSSDPWGTSSKLLEAESQFLQEADVGQAAKRSKRGALHLYNMVLCATGCDPLAFKGYGCYCGFLGSGYTVDGIDRWEERSFCLLRYGTILYQESYLSTKVANRVLCFPVDSISQVPHWNPYLETGQCEWLVRDSSATSR